MMEIFVYSTPSTYEGCLYGSEERRNHSMKRDQAVALLMSLTLVFLLFNGKLRKLYAPLAVLVNVSIIVRLVQCITYFAYYPYEENEGNCTEIFLSRIYSGVIMLGELHQVYFLANFLGLGKFSFTFATLPQLLNVMTVIIMMTIVGSLYLRKLLIIRNLWTFVLACMQIYFIKKSRVQTVLDNKLISGSASCVKLFEKFSICQLLPSAFCLVKRLLSVFGISLFGNLISVPNTMDEMCVLLFYLKVLIIQENADVSIEVIDE